MAPWSKYLLRMLCKHFNSYIWWAHFCKLAQTKLNVRCTLCLYIGLQMLTICVQKAPTLPGCSHHTWHKQCKCPWCSQAHDVLVMCNILWCVHALDIPMPAMWKYPWCACTRDVHNPRMCKIQWGASARNVPMLVMWQCPWYAHGHGFCLCPSWYPTRTVPMPVMWQCSWCAHARYVPIPVMCLSL